MLLPIQRRGRGWGGTECTGLLIPGKCTSKEVEETQAEANKTGTDTTDF